MALPFLKNRVKKREHAVAFDLGTRTTKAVYVQRKGSDFSLAGYTIQDAPVSEKSLSREMLAEHLKKVSQALGARTKQVVLMLGAADSLVRLAEMPMVPVSDMRIMVKLNPKNYLQQDLPDHLFDCFILPPKPGANGAERGKAPQKCRVLVGGAKRTIVEDLQVAAKTAGLVAEQIVPNLIGPINTLELAEPELFSKENVAVVDLGFRHATISILEAGEMALNRVVALGGDKLTSGLAEAMNIKYAEAEAIKLSMTSEAEAILQAILMPLGRELRASIDFFEHQQDKTVSQIFVAGGSAQSDFIVKTMQTELMVQCNKLNPAKFLGLALGPEQQSEFEQVSPKLAAAIGAAITA